MPDLRMLPVGPDDSGQPVQVGLHEIAYRKVNSFLWLLSVSVAVGCLVGAVTLLEIDEIQTRGILAQKEQAVQDSGTQLEDAMRIITKGLGFNLLILPADQDLNELHLEGTLSSSMPESYADRLANSEIVTINHLLPTVTQKIEWSDMSDRLGSAAERRDLMGRRDETDADDVGQRDVPDPGDADPFSMLRDAASGGSSEHEVRY